MNQQIHRKQAARIFDEYLEAILRGQKPDATTYLERCPGEEVDRLRDAFEGLALIVKHYYASTIQQGTIDKTLQRIQQIKRLKSQVAEAHQRSTALLQSQLINPVKFLTHVLNIPEGMADSQRRPTQPSMLFRGEMTALPQNASSIDEIRVKMLERSVEMRIEGMLRQSMINKAPVDLNRLIEHLNLFVQTTSLDGIDGCMVAYQNLGGILINKNIADARRRRFTLAHEISHYILHKHLQTFTDTEQSIHSFAISAEAEMEANIGASTILMPSFLLPAGFGNVQPSFEQAEALAERYDVSFSAAARRMVRSSHWQCLFVAIKDSMVQWYARSPEIEGYLKIKRRLHPDTMAAYLYRSAQEGEEHSAVLPAETWVEGSLADDGAELREVSRHMTNGYVYSLLTVME